MRKYARLSCVAMVLLAMAVLAVSGTASAQECMAGTFGPLTLATRQTVTLCVTNLDAKATRRVGFAFYDAFDAREPLRLEFANVVVGAGHCASFHPSRDALTIVARAGFIRGVDDPAQPLALSAQISKAGDVDGRDFLVWQRGPVDPPSGPLV